MAFTINTFFVDLDGCLITPNLTKSVPHRIAQYAVKYLKYDVGDATRRCIEGYRRNGTNLEAFLREGHAIDPDHYHAFIHGKLAYSTHLTKMPEMKRVLDTIPVDKYIFTNADVKHARTCLDMTGLDTCFSGIIGFETLMDLYDGPFTPCKPKYVAMQLALKHARADPLRTLYFDDQARNIHMGMDCGVRSVLVGQQDTACEYFHHISSLLDLETQLFSSYFEIS